MRSLPARESIGVRTIRVKSGIVDPLPGMDISPGPCRDGPSGRWDQKSLSERPRQLSDCVCFRPER